MKKIVLSLVLLPTSLLCFEGVLSLPIPVVTMAPGMKEHAAKTAHLDPLTQQLHAAAKEGNENAINELLAQGAQVNGCDSWGSTSLHWAVENNHEACVKSLVITGKALLDVQNNGGYTPLHYAAKLDLAPIVSFLLEQGANQHIRDNEGKIVFQRAFESHYGNGNSFAILHSHGARIDSLPAQVQTPLPVCSLANGIGTLRHLLTTPTESTHYASQGQKDLALSLAVRWGRTACAALLLAHRANPEVPVHKKISYILPKGFFGVTSALPLTPHDEAYRALPYALKHDNELMVDLLLKAGANKEAPQRITVTRALRPLALATWKKRTSLMRKLIDAGAQVDGRSPLRITALHIAAYNDDIEALRILLESNASPNCQTIFGDTPLYTALIKNSACAQLLRDHVATLEFLESNPMYHACKYGDRNEFLQAVRIFYCSLWNPTEEDKPHIDSIVANAFNENLTSIDSWILLLNELQTGTLHSTHSEPITESGRATLIKNILEELAQFFRFLQNTGFVFPESIADLCIPEAVEKNLSEIVSAGIDERIAELQRKANKKKSFVDLFSNKRTMEKAIIDLIDKRIAEALRKESSITTSAQSSDPVITQESEAKKRKTDTESPHE